MDFTSPHAHSHMDLLGLFCMSQAYSAFAQISQERDSTAGQELTSLGSRNCQKNKDAELLGGDKEVPGTISVPCLCCSVEISSPDGSTGKQMYWRG